VTIDELVGENLRRVRAALGLSASGLAHRMMRLGLSFDEAWLARLEAGEQRITVDELVALGLALGAPPALLLSPLNLGSLLCVDTQGRPLASWSLFQGWGNPLSAPGPGEAFAPAGPALQQAPPAEPALQQAPPAEPALGQAPPAEPAAPPSLSPSPPPPTRQEPAPEATEPAAEPAEEPEPLPTPSRPEPNPPEAGSNGCQASPQDREWALKALHELRWADRSDAPGKDQTALLRATR
jgi:transcriptional regulator with XRE-family HTH domain